MLAFALHRWRSKHPRISSCLCIASYVFFCSCIAHAWNESCDNSHMGWRAIRVKVMMTFVSCVPSFEQDDWTKCIEFPSHDFG